MAFVNVTVDTSALSRTATRDTGTVGIVGEGTSASTSALLIGSYSDIEAEYPTDNDLSLAVKLALDNGAAKVWIADVGATISTTAAATALELLEPKDIQVVAIANTVETDVDAYFSDKLKAHCAAAQTERVGIFMLDAAEDAASAPSAVTGLLTADTDRLIAIAHNSTKDVASAVAGMLVKYNPWESPVLKPIKGIDQSVGFTTTQREALTTAHLNAITDPIYLSGTGLVLADALTMGANASGLYYIDVRRTLDDISYKVKATLTNPTVIGTLQINKTGIGRLGAILSGLLQTAVNDGEIEGFDVDIPVGNALSKELKSRSVAESALITAARTTRNVDVTIAIEYSGAIHSVDVDIKFTV